MRTAATISLVIVSFFWSLAASAQQAPVLLAMSDAQAVSAPKGATMVLAGRVESPAGPLVGAVVAVNGRAYQKAVTNGDGEFRLQVPTTTEPIALTASYGGYRDVSATVLPGTTLAPLRLTEVQEIKVSRKLRLKRYVKYAHKEARRESRRLHRG